MTKWEYKTLVIKESETAGTINHLAKLGGSGWELVSPLFISSASAIVYFFKRPIEEVASPTLDLSHITRLEVIDEVERKYVRHDISVEPSVQDEGRTLKLFVKEKV